MFDIGSSVNKIDLENHNKGDLLVCRERRDSPKGESYFVLGHISEINGPEISEANQYSVLWNDEDCTIYYSTIEIVGFKKLLIEAFNGEENA